MPETPIPRRGYGAPPQIPPLGAPALRAYRASLEAGSGPSAPPSSPNHKSWMHPWAHTPSENPGYADAIGMCA